MPIGEYVGSKFQAGARSFAKKQIESAENDYNNTLSGGQNINTISDRITQKTEMMRALRTILITQMNQWLPGGNPTLPNYPYGETWETDPTKVEKVLVGQVVDYNGDSAKESYERSLEQCKKGFATGLLYQSSGSSGKIFFVKAEQNKITHIDVFKDEVAKDGLTPEPTIHPHWRNVPTELLWMNNQDPSTKDELIDLLQSSSLEECYTKIMKRNGILNDRFSLDVGNELMVHDRYKILRGTDRVRLPMSGLQAAVYRGHFYRVDIVERGAGILPIQFNTPGTLMACCTTHAVPGASNYLQGMPGRFAHMMLTGEERIIEEVTGG